MSLNNRIISHSSFSNNGDMLGKDVLIYAYAKDNNILNKQIEQLKTFSINNNLNIKAIYIDTLESNKSNLKKLINNNSNITVLVVGIDRLSRKIRSILDIKDLCNKKNIDFFDINSNDLIFNKLFSSFEKIIEEISKQGSDKKLQRNINVLYIEPNKLPIKKTIKNSLEEKQKLVGGYIEYTYLNDCNDIAIVCNEEGKLLGLPPNRDIGHDIICGNFFIVGDDPELGEDRSLTEEQIAKYTKYFGKKSIEKTIEKYNEKLFSSLDI